MKKLLLMLCVMGSVNGTELSYKTLDEYSQIFFALLQDYVTTHSTDNPQNVVDFVNSDKTKTNFSDASRSGYSRTQLLFQTYQYSFTTTPVVTVIVEALQICVMAEHQLEQAVFWTTWSMLGWSGITLIYMIRSTYRYFKRDNPLLTYYANNDAGWLRATMTSSTPLGTNRGPEPVI